MMHVEMIRPPTSIGDNSHRGEKRRFTLSVNALESIARSMERVEEIGCGMMIARNKATL